MLRVVNDRGAAEDIGYGMYAGAGIVRGLLQALHHIGVIRNVLEAQLFEHSLLHAEIEPGFVHGDDVIGARA